MEQNVRFTYTYQIFGALVDYFHCNLNHLAGDKGNHRRGSEVYHFLALWQLVQEFKVAGIQHLLPKEIT